MEVHYLDRRRVLYHSCLLNILIVDIGYLLNLIHVNTLEAFGIHKQKKSKDPLWK